MAMTRVRHDAPPPRLVRYNDWRRVEVPEPGAFAPELPASVIVPYCAQPEELARTLAALEGQTYPRELFEVVVVDDGSPEPLARLPPTPLDAKVVRQEDLGFGLARARNTGARAAAHDVLVFLDGDMMPEAGWLAAHARWHHAVPDAVTLGPRAHVAADGVDAEAIRNRPGTLEELLEGRNVETDDRDALERFLRRTDDLTSRTDFPFDGFRGNNCGIRRRFHDLVGGFDESFTQWGGEDTEYGYRAYTRGGLMVPVRDAFAWHQGSWRGGQAEKKQSRKLQLAKLAHLIAHPWFRTGTTGRIFTVPQYVVTMRGDALSAERLLGSVERVLAGSMHDLVVRLELPGDHPGREWLERHLGPDPRVRVAPSRPALEEFPASPFHVTLPAGKPLHADVVRRLRDALGTAAVGRSAFSDGSRVSIARAWALHRASRTPWEASDFGEAVTIPPRKLRPAPAPAGSTGRALRASWQLLGAELRSVDSPGAAWWLVRHLASTALRRARALRRPDAVPSRPTPEPSIARAVPAPTPGSPAPLRDGPPPGGGADGFSALAAGIHGMLGRQTGDDDTGALRDLAEKLVRAAPTDVHRAVARDLRDALSDGAFELAASMAATAKLRPDLGAEKIISRKYGYVWICVPKVASRSIRNLLCVIDPAAEVIHRKSVSDVYATYPEARDYYSFAFVRDPFRRTFSFYAEKYLMPTEEKRKWFIDPYHGASPAFSFDDLCRWLTTPYGSDAFADRHWLSQSRQVALDDGRLPDFVGRHENLDADFRAVCERLDMPAHELPRVGTMAGWNPTEEELRDAAPAPDRHLTEGNRALLRERYAEDLAFLDRLEGRG